jgi:hypothetical protein
MKERVPAIELTGKFFAPEKSGRTNRSRPHGSVRNCPPHRGRQVHPGCRIRRGIRRPIACGRAARALRRRRRQSGSGPLFQCHLRLRQHTLPMRRNFPFRPWVVLRPDSCFETIDVSLEDPTQRALATEDPHGFLVRSAEVLALHPSPDALFETWAVGQFVEGRFNLDQSADLPFRHDSNGMAADLIFEIGARLQSVEIGSRQTATRNCLTTSQASGRVSGDEGLPPRFINDGNDYCEWSGIRRSGRREIAYVAVLPAPTF